MLDMLVTDLNKLCDELPFHTGWYLKNLRTGETAHRMATWLSLRPVPARSPL